MLLVIFGAGASYDSVLHLPPPTVGSRRELHEDARPPLANQLFDNRRMFVGIMDLYAACKPLINLLRGEVQVEQQLTKFEEEAKTYPQRRSQLAAIRYYLHHMLWNCEYEWRKANHRGITNHSTFLDAIEHWRYTRGEEVYLVTFNYDRILEQSMEELWGRSFEDFSAYISNPEYKLIKLHGSVDWGMRLIQFPPHTAPATIIKAAAVLDFDNSREYQKIVRPPGITDDPQGLVALPALAIPVQNKSEFSCPPEHLKSLADVLPKVTKIITIGWRATEQHLLRMLNSPLTGLKKGSVALMIVSGSPDGLRETARNLGFIPRVTVDNGFSGLIRDRLTPLEQFLW